MFLGPGCGLLLSLVGSLVALVVGFLCCGVCLFRADAPFLCFLGEVLSDFRLLLWPFASCTAIVCLGIALFGNKFLIIQKKKKK